MTKIEKTRTTKVISKVTHVNFGVNYSIWLVLDSRYCSFEHGSLFGKR